MEISELYTIYTKSPHITTDTRNIQANSIFFALKGERFNGNQFAQKAIDQGCSYAVVDEKEYATGSQFILVNDVLEVLQALAIHHRKQFKIPIVAITGTNGKTTTKDLTARVLEKQYKVLYTHGNLNNHIGVPLTLLQLTNEHEIAIIEMGANHPGEIAELCKIAAPNFGLITNIGIAHMEGFGSFENLVKTKKELYDYIGNQDDGKIFLDAENLLLKELALEEELTAIEYGTADCEDYFINGGVIENTPFLKFKWCIANQVCQIVETHLVGCYNLTNALAAITIGKYFGVNSNSITQAITEYEPTNNRSQLKQTNKNKLIIDAYNANPTSMKAALENFKTLNVDQKVLILGDMKELGVNSLLEHQTIVDYAEQNGFDHAILVGENFAQIDSKYPHCKNCEELKAYLVQNPIINSYILLKGSRGMKLEECIDLL